MPQELQDFMNRLKSYQTELDDLGIKDYQVLTLDDGASSAALSLEKLSERAAEQVFNDLKVPYRVGHLLFVLLCSAIPAIFLNLPIGILATVYAEKKRKKVSSSRHHLSFDCFCVPFDGLLFLLPFRLFSLYLFSSFCPFLFFSSRLFLLRFRRSVRAR